MRQEAANPVSTSGRGMRKARFARVWHFQNLNSGFTPIRRGRADYSGPMNTPALNGAEAVVRTLVANGVDTCFANPGTSEMHFVAALDRVGGIRCVLGLAETVVMACADGYARMARKPGVGVVHLGMGLSNGVASLHNARVARSPVLALVGDHATFHKQSDSGGVSDIEGMAHSVSGWVRTSASAGAVGADTASAVQAAMLQGNQVSTLILPADVSWNGGASVGAPLASPLPPRVAPGIVSAMAQVLRSGERAVIVLDGQAQTEAGLVAAQRIASVTGAQLRTNASVGRMARGRGRVPVDRIPYNIDPALKMLEGVRHVVLVGARQPTAFFAYPGKPSLLAPSDAVTHVLARPQQDEVAALEALADELGAPREVPIPELTTRPERVRGPFDPQGFASTLGALLPENAIVYDDAVSSGRPLFEMTHNAPPHDWLMNCGGAIGHGIPCAAGAAIAAPDRKVVCLQGDGGGMYSLMALWTHAREKLDIVTVVFANHKYRILYNELLAVGAQPGPASNELFSISGPELDWRKLAGGMGVESARVTTLEGFADAFQAACRRRGPFLIEFSF